MKNKQIWDEISKERQAKGYKRDGRAWEPISRTSKEHMLIVVITILFLETTKKMQLL